jgi:hypothetical protein
MLETRYAGNMGVGDHGADRGARIVQYGEFASIELATHRQGPFGSSRSHENAAMRPPDIGKSYLGISHEVRTAGGIYLGSSRLMHQRKTKTGVPSACFQAER